VRRGEQSGDSSRATPSRAMHHAIETARCRFRGIRVVQRRPRLGAGACADGNGDTGLARANLYASTAKEAYFGLVLDGNRLHHRRAARVLPWS
jgi:hypothetical protein